MHKIWNNKVTPQLHQFSQGYFSYRVTQNYEIARSHLDL